MIIILLGEGCQISWDVEKLKLDKNRSIFEWFLSVKFPDILHIIKKLSCDEELEITTQEKYKDNLFMDNTDIRSTHYSHTNLKEILKRRGKRFIDDVKSNEKILFIRYEHCEYATTENDIKEFDTLIKNINPECNYNLLIFANVNKTNLLNYNLKDNLPYRHVLYNNKIEILDKYIKEYLAKV